MFSNWEKYSRQGINVASAATSAGFSAAKRGTSFGFDAAKTVTSSVFSVAGSAFDYALYGGDRGTGQALGGAVTSAISFIENIALAPILLGETLTMTSLVAAQSSIETLSSMFPGSDEASFSLASFITLVRREWNEPALQEHLPAERYSVAEVAKALVAWGALQSVTQDLQEQKWFSALREIDLNEPDAGNALDSYLRKRSYSKVHITEDTKLPENDGHILTADIGEAPSPNSNRSLTPTPTGLRNPLSPYQIKLVLRRFSKMVLGGYGGIGIIFFGLPLTPKHSEETGNSDANGSREQRTLANVVDAAEQESSASDSPSAKSTKKEKQYSWWDVLLGKHDQDIFEDYAAISTQSTSSSSLADGLRDPKTSERPRRSTAMVVGDGRTPRFWVLTDHGRKQIVLVFRGTMSINELAVDLTCDPAPFEPASGNPEASSRPAENVDPIADRLKPGGDNTDTSSDDEGVQMNDDTNNNSVPFPRTNSGPRRPRPTTYDVHSGMLKIARVMGKKGKPLHTAVRDALRKNRGYELVLCGHSLGAGVAGLLALTWADLETCLTIKASGLPVGRRVSAYCFAPPCLVSASLAAKSQNLITSFVYSHDIVSRLSLGSIRDMTRAAMWLCNANKQKNNGDGKSDEGYAGVTKRALKFKAGYGQPGDPEWFLAVRKTLEANMQMAHLFPPGRVWWAIHDNDLSPSRRLGARNNGDDNKSNPVRVFEVLDVEKVFSQIVFARDMLSSHLPGQYDRVLHELL